MKKTVLLLFALFLFTGFSHAQEGLKAVKKASRLLGNYNLDPSANADKIVEAKDLIMKAFESDEVKSSAKAYQVKGDILAKIASEIVNESILKGSEAVADKDISVGIDAVSAYKKAYELAEKKFEKKDAISSMTTLQQNVIENVAIVAYQNKNWKTAYDGFQATIELGDFMKEIGAESTLTDEKKEELMINSVSVAAQEGSGIDLGAIVEKSIGMGIKDATLYQMAYTAFEKTNKSKAVEYLTKGVEMFPDNSGLLFAQINYYLSEGKLELLIDKLKAAIKAEPDNASVYGVLGNTYDQLSVKMGEEGNEAKSEEYFNGALEYYTKATEIDPKSFNSYYGMGVLYFNKAAKVGKALNELGSDYSDAGIKKYDAMKAEMNGYYEQSFPFLEKAESIKPNDPSVLQALREYYARTGKDEKSNEYKMKMEAVGAGN